MSQDQENTKNNQSTEKKSVSAPPKREISESESMAVEENLPVENLGVEKNEEVLGEDFLAEPKNPPVEKSKIAGEKIEETPQTENLPPVEIQEVEPIKTVQTQEILPQPEIKTIEKIIYQTDPNFIQKLLVKARAKIQERKRKKLDKIMTLFETKTQIKNKDVRKLLRTARRSAVRYLDILEKEQKITQIGNIGKGVRYTKKQ